jgi:hypothetical protein
MSSKICDCWVYVWMECLSFLSPLVNHGKLEMLWRVLPKIAAAVSAETIYWVLCADLNVYSHNFFWFKGNDCDLAIGR